MDPIFSSVKSKNPAFAMQDLSYHKLRIPINARTTPKAIRTNPPIPIAGVSDGLNGSSSGLGDSLFVPSSLS